jgi:hypothetical protein
MTSTAPADATRVDGLIAIDRGPAGRADAQGRAVVTETLVPAFPSYPRLCGFPVVSLVTARRAEAIRGSRGEPVIVLDPSLWAEGEEAHRTFLIAHECAHHRLGHLDRAVLRQRAADVRVVADNELSADCWAAEMLGRDGLDDVVRVMAERFFRAGGVPPGAGYPSGIARSIMVRDCGAAGRAARLRSEARSRR